MQMSYNKQLEKLTKERARFRQKNAFHSILSRVLKSGIVVNNQDVSCEDKQINIRHSLNYITLDIRHGLSLDVPVRKHAVTVGPCLKHALYKRTLYKSRRTRQLCR